jgi:TolB-like protein/DNA-binding winged helix-turn-helix (wHTH) protein/Tfp pilus assembly protein PilF
VGDLWKQGIRTRLHGKPLEVLQALVERPGTVVSRKELQARLWAADTHVEFENGLNNAISRLRDALGDSADSPRFVETVPRRGYRFIAPVETVRNVPDGVTPPAPDALGTARRSRRGWLWPLAALVALATLAVGWGWTRPAPSQPLESVVVLPFVTGGATDASTDEYVAFGMTDALISELSRAGSLHVISQTSALRYRGTDKALPQIARELGVGAVVEGSVVREGDQVRITVQLIHAARDTHLWADSYRRDGGSILATHGEVAREAAREIRRRLVTDAPAPPGPSRGVDPAVREAHLKGRYFMSQGTEAARARALAFFEEALALDPGHAPTHAGVADYYILTDAIAPDVAVPRAKAHAERALELDPSLVDAHVTLALLHYYGDWDWASAERRFETALDLDPRHTRGRRRYGMFLAAMGRSAEATVHVRQALELDPVSVRAHDSAGQVWLHARHADRLLEQGRRILELAPRADQGFEHLAAAHVLRWEYDQAFDAVQQGLAASGRAPVFIMLLAWVEGARGREVEARAAVEELERAATDGFVPPFLLAAAHLGAGDPHVALDWLEKGYDSRDAYLVFLKASPWMDPLRSEPRFQALLQRMRFP